MNLSFYSTGSWLSATANRPSIECIPEVGFGQRIRVSVSHSDISLPQFLHGEGKSTNFWLTFRPYSSLSHDRVRNAAIRLKSQTVVERGSLSYVIFKYGKFGSPPLKSVWRLDYLKIGRGKFVKSSI